MMTDHVRIAVGGFSHETNAFSALWTELEDFNVVRGTDMKTVEVTLGYASLATTSTYGSVSNMAQKKALQEHAL